MGSAHYLPETPSPQPATVPTPTITDQDGEATSPHKCRVMQHYVIEGRLASPARIAACMNSEQFVIGNFEEG